MSVYKRPGSPYYQYKIYINGKPVRGSTRKSSRREAEQVEKDEKQRLEREAERGVALAGVPTVATVFARYWTAHGCKLAWASAVKEHMRESLIVIGPDTLINEWTNAMTAEVLDEFAASENRNFDKEKAEKDGRQIPTVKNGTVNRRMAVLRQIWRKARDAWDLPVLNIKWKEHNRKEPRERIRHITVDQAKRVVKLLPKHIQIMVAWTLATGCRLSETYSLRWSRVNYETLQAEVETKGGGTRFVDLSPDAVMVLALCKPDDKELSLIGDAYVFDTTNRRKLWEAAVKEAGLDDFHWHDLRHTFATWMGTTGAGLHVVQKALGHSRIETTMKYLHVIRGDVRDAVSRLPTVLESDVRPMKKRMTPREPATQFEAAQSEAMKRIGKGE